MTSLTGRQTTKNESSAPRLALHQMQKLQAQAFACEPSPPCNETSYHPLHRQNPLQCVFHFAGMKSKRSGSALERNASAAVDDIHAVRPSCVGALRGIVEPVEKGRNL